MDIPRYLVGANRTRKPDMLMNYLEFAAAAAENDVKQKLE
jgi:hypothetical protein